MIRKHKIVVTFFILLSFINNVAFSADRIINIVGSSTIFPFMATVVEIYKNINSDVEVILEANGTGGGIKLFCSGGKNSIDIVNASRPIEQKEIELCKKNQIENIEELIIGMDGIVFAVNPNNKLKDLSLDDLYLALTSYLEKDGVIVKNNYKYWDEINNKLPHVAIKIYGPPVSSGTRETIVHKILNSQCKLDKNKYSIVQQKIYCSLIREDGAFVDVGENDNLVAQKILLNEDAVGVLGFNFYMENQKMLNAISINKILPNIKNIQTQKYPISRPLYVYVNANKFYTNPDLKSFYNLLKRPELFSNKGILVEKGLVPVK